MRNRGRRRAVEAVVQANLRLATNAELREALWDVVIATQLDVIGADPTVRRACERAIVLLERGEVAR